MLEYLDQQLPLPWEDSSVGCMLLLKVNIGLGRQYTNNLKKDKHTTAVHKSLHRKLIVNSNMTTTKNRVVPKVELFFSSYFICVFILFTLYHCYYIYLPSFVSDLPQIGGLLCVLRFSPQLKLTSAI